MTTRSRSRTSPAGRPSKPFSVTTISPNPFNHLTPQPARSSAMLVPGSQVPGNPPDPRLPSQIGFVFQGSLTTKTQSPAFSYTYSPKRPKAWVRFVNSLPPLGPGTGHPTSGHPISSPSTSLPMRHDNDTVRRGWIAVTVLRVPAWRPGWLRTCARAAPSRRRIWIGTARACRFCSMKCVGALCPPPCRRLLFALALAAHRFRLTCK